MILSHTLAHPTDHSESIPFAVKAEFGSAHLIGICGSGMKALAEFLSGAGCQVTGSDLQVPTRGIRALERRGLYVHRGHHDLFLPRDVDVVVYSRAVGPENPERRLATKLGIPQFSYAEILGELMRNRTGISVAGTHGKSTTTAMTATILTDAGLSPSAIVGAELCRSGKNGWAGDGSLFVVESCEYKRSFLELTPKFAAILGIEPDHFDCFQSLDDAESAFHAFAQRVPDDGLLLVNHHCPVSERVARGTAAEVETFGIDPSADWWAADLRKTSAGMRFRIFFRGQYFTEAQVPLPGRHNVMNALAAAALSHHQGVSPANVRESLQDFGGIRRRFETVGSWRGVTLIDDYAHHPTAVAATLRAARERFGRRRILCAFQPHQVSRTQRLLEEFASSFCDADEVLIVPVYAAREADAEAAITATQELVARVSDYVPGTRYVASLDQLVTTLEDEARPGDVLITMGAGDIDRVQHEFTRRLQRHHSAG